MRACAIAIAALFLATGTVAEARSFETYDCGKDWIEEVFAKYFSPYFDRCDDGPCDGKEHYFDSRDVASGRKCRKLTDEE